MIRAAVVVAARRARRRRAGGQKLAEGFAVENGSMTYPAWTKGLTISECVLELLLGSGVVPTDGIKKLSLCGFSVGPLANGKFLDALPNLTDVEFTVDRNTTNHVEAVTSHLNSRGIGAESVTVSGEFDDEEWFYADNYEWTKYFEVDGISSYIAETESGSSLQMSLGRCVANPVADHGALTQLLRELATELTDDTLLISRTNEGGTTYSCTKDKLKTVEFEWEEMNEGSSSFNCDDGDDWDTFIEMIGDLQLSQGFFDNEWSGKQVDQENWLISGFSYPMLTSINVCWGAN